MPVIDTLIAGLFALGALGVLRMAPTPKPVPVRVKRKPTAH
ncbi:hypothetical protein ACFFGF_02020 [Asaia lannensis]|nr:hypothetical protein [Asaia lannensis]GBR00200.1 hypothetical protein AA102526_2081 [Asaia lannensis NBRC 102526]